jgi:hypothetical protein
VYDRVVIGGGLFGAYSAIVLSKLGLRVLLIEQDGNLLNRASFVNQARLHTGLHYPRSFATAQDALVNYERFRRNFSSAVIDFEQVYAVSKFNSKTSAQGFSSFASRLGVNCSEINPSRYFNSGTISAAFMVEEPTFSASRLRGILAKQLEAQKGVDVLLGRRVTQGEITEDGAKISLHDGTVLEAKGVVIATYAATNSLLQIFGLKPLPLEYELAEVVLGNVNSKLANTGITVMDGPFWSLMPFGDTKLASLTSVGFTPIQKSNLSPVFDCQIQRSDCGPGNLADCNSCHVQPKSNFSHHIQQMKLYLKSEFSFTPSQSMFTVKTILGTTEVDDARPTVIQKDENLPLWTVFSGKVSSIFDLEGALT